MDETVDIILGIVAVASITCIVFFLVCCAINKSCKNKKKKEEDLKDEKVGGV